MEDKRQYIESVFQSMITNAHRWRERELDALYQEDSITPVIIPPLPEKVIDFDWNGTEKELKLIYQFFKEERITPRTKENSWADFAARIYNTPYHSNKIKLLNTKKALWCFFILQFKRKITNKALFDVLPQRFSKVFANGKEQELKRKNLISELWEMRDTNPINYPEYVNELLLILKLKS